MFRFLIFSGWVAAQVCEDNAAKRGCANDQVQTFVKLSAEDQENFWDDNRRFLFIFGDEKLSYGAPRGFLPKLRKNSPQIELF